MCADVMVCGGPGEYDRGSASERFETGRKTTIDRLFDIMVNAGYPDAVARLEKFRENQELIRFSLEVMSWDNLDEEDKEEQALGLVANVFGNTDEGIIKCMQDATRRLQYQRMGY